MPATRLFGRLGHIIPSTLGLTLHRQAPSWKSVRSSPGHDVLVSHLDALSTRRSCGGAVLRGV
jgi:hypothetical protein